LSVESKFIRVARVEEIPPGTVKAFELDFDRVAVVNLDGEFYAISDICTHEHAYLYEGEIIDGTIECPLHGSRFDIRTGRVLALPAVVPVKTYPVAVENGEIYVAPA